MLYFSFASQTTSYLINRLPTRVLHGKSPLELLRKDKPNFSHLRVFGCICYVHIPRQFRDKLDIKGRKCVFIGYASFQKGYICFEPDSNKVYTSKDVIFVENEFFFAGEKNEENSSSNDLRIFCDVPINPPLVPQESNEGNSLSGGENEEGGVDESENEADNKIPSDYDTDVDLDS